MAEVFGILAGGVGIADVAIRLAKYLKNVKSAVGTVEGDIDSLIKEVELLATVHGEVETILKRNVDGPALDPGQRSVWTLTAQSLKQGREVILMLESTIKEIYGDDPKVQGKRDGFNKQHRKRAAEPRLSEIRSQLCTHHSSLQILLELLSQLTAARDHQDTRQMLTKLEDALHGIAKAIDDSEAASPRTDATLWAFKQQEFTNASIATLNKISSSITAVEKYVTRSATNQHFDIPHNVDRFYTGRSSEAKKLASWFFENGSNSPQQKRFVVYGVGGSGKTQFCCKFAEYNRERFWGVFFVEAGTEALLKQTLAKNVAQVGRVAENDKAALNWLSNLDKTWLLIIDNADDANINLDHFIPKGNRGFVLITTRNPDTKSYGNVGAGSFEFQGLKDDEASSLLLTAADRPRPWDATTSSWAEKISKALGYLALAIAVAGASIREGLCQFHEYLDYYEEQRHTRRGHSRRRNAARQRSHSADSHRGTVDAAFDLTYQAIECKSGQDSRDALQLLRMFSFLHNENIRFEFLERAVTNGALEAVQQVEDKKRELVLKASDKRQSWSQWANGSVFSVLTYLYRIRGPLTLPELLRSGRLSNDFDRIRLREALRQLTRRSLVRYNDARNSYSMHPLVHEWARDALDLTLGEKAIWAEAAAVMLSSCILLPPLGTKDEELRKDLLPHVDHVRKQQALIDQHIRDNRLSRMKPWPIFEGGFNSDRAMMYAKFSIVYAQNGRWEDAKGLQIAVKDFTMKVLGLQHPVTRRIVLALATTLLQLGQSNEAAIWQEQVVDACTEFLGPDHHDTLIGKHHLGESRYLQGRFSDARILQETAVDGLQRLHGQKHEDTLNAIDSLGRTVIMFYRVPDYERARELHKAAFDGLTELLGRDHTRTLIACEHLCVTAVHTGIKHQLLQADEMMKTVLETRSVRLGKEHGYTLLAMANLAQIKRELGQLDEAEQLMLTALPIAARNLGPDNVACLWGQYLLGSILARQQRWNEAEAILRDVADRQQQLLHGRGRHHPDRIGALAELAAVYHALGKHGDCERTVDEALYALSVISTTEHPLAVKLKADRENWREEIHKTQK